MAAITECCIHAVDCGDPVISSTDKSRAKITECALKWKNIPTNESEFNCATKTIENRESSEGYHRQCYQKFCNTSYISKCESRMNKKVAAEIEYSSNTSSQAPGTSSSKRVTRRQTGGSKG